MTATITRLVPNATANIGACVATGAATLHQCANDSSDATYISHPAGGTAQTSCELDYGTVAIPAGSTIISVTPGARMSCAAATARITVQFVASDGTLGPTLISTANIPAAVTDYVGTAATTDAKGVAWTQTSIDALRTKQRQTIYGATASRVYETYLDVAYNQPPTATVSAPTGTITTSLRPPVTWAYTDPEGDTQSAFRVKIFDAATYGGGSFDPATTTAQWDSGTIYSSASSITPTIDLISGTTYRAYVLVFDGTGWAIAWAFSGFTVLLNSTATPAITATAEPTLGRTKLDIQGRENMLTANQSSLETDTTGWAALSNCTITRSTTWALDANASLRLSSAAAGTMTATTTQGAAGAPAAAGVTYLGRATFRTAVTARNCRVGLEFFNGAASLGITWATAVANSTTGVEIAVGAVAPANTTDVAVRVEVQGTAAAADLHYVDKIAVSPFTFDVWTFGGFADPLTFEVEYSDNGTDWHAVRDATGVAATATLQTATVYDYEAPATSRSYRARSVGINGGARVAAISPTVAATLTLTTWWLTDPLNLLTNWSAANVLGPRSTRITEEATVFQPIGRNTPIVVAEAILEAVSIPHDGDLRLLTLDVASWTILEPLLAARRPLLLRGPFGDCRYIRLIGDRSIDLTRTPTNPRREIAASYVEVDRP